MIPKHAHVCKSQSVGGHVSQLVRCVVGQSVGQVCGWSGVWLVSQLVRCVVGQSVGQVCGWSVSWSGVWLVNQLVWCVVGQSVGQSISINQSMTVCRSQ